MKTEKEKYDLRTAVADAEIPSELEYPTTGENGCEYGDCGAAHDLDLYLDDIDRGAVWLCPEHFKIWKRSIEQRREQDHQE